MKKLLILAMIFLAYGLAEAQSQINYYKYIPNGYQLKDVNGELGPASKVDFDKDGIEDLAIILFDNKDNLPIFCIYLSSNFNTSKSLTQFKIKNFLNNYSINEIFQTFIEVDYYSKTIVIIKDFKVATIFS